MALGETEVAEALYDFDASHTDELSFRQRDLITILQKLDGGWWEGGIGTRSGWFPEALVRLCNNSTANGKSGTDEACANSSPKNEEHASPSQLQQPSSGTPRMPNLSDVAITGNAEHISNGHDNSSDYLIDVVRSIVVAEQTYYRQLKATREEIFWPLSSSNLLTDDDYITLCGNIDDLVDIYEKLVQNLYSRSGTGFNSIGHIFLELAEQVRPAMEIFCANHPRAVMLINKYRDILMQFCRKSQTIAHVIRGASSVTGEVAADDVADVATNALPLAGVLSMPFRCLERYPMMLQEYLRYLPESDPDHVKTRRAVEAFTQLNADLSEIRRQKEIEIELESGNIENYHGPPLHGPIQALHKFRCLRRPEQRQTSSNKVAATYSSSMHIAVFPQILVIMSASSHLSEFSCEAWFYLSDINVTINDDLAAAKHGSPPVASTVAKLYFAIDCISSNDRWSFSSLKSSTAASNFLQRLVNAVQQCKPRLATAVANGNHDDADDDQFVDESTSAPLINGSSRIPDRRGRRLHTASQRTAAANGAGRKIAPASTSSESSTSVPTSLSSSSSSHTNDLSVDANNTMSRHTNGTLPGKAGKHISPELLFERQRSIQQLKKMFRQAPSLRPDPPLRPAGASNATSQELHAQQHNDAVATLGGGSFARNVMQTSSARVGKSRGGGGAEPPVFLAGKKFGAAGGSQQTSNFEKQASGFVYNKPAACYQYETDNNIESDAALLNVVESYCSSSRARSNVNADSTKVIVPNDEKLLIEDADGMIVGERSLIDTVYYLSDCVKTLSEEMRRLTNERDAERRGVNGNDVNGTKAVRHSGGNLTNGASATPAVMS